MRAIILFALSFFIFTFLVFVFSFISVDVDQYSKQRDLCSKMGGTFEMHTEYNAGSKTNHSSPMCYLKAK